MPASILEIVSVGTNQGEALLNRWHFVNPAGLTDVSAVLPAFVEDVLTPYAGFGTTQLHITELLYRIVTDPLAPQSIYAITPPLDGPAVATPAPSFVTATIRWAIGATVILTAEAPQRRVRRGSKHIGGMRDDWVTGNVWAPDKVALLAQIPEGYLGMSDGGFLPCVCGYPKRPKHVPGAPSRPADPPNKYALIEGYSINTRIGSEVSRKAGHGS